MLKFDFNTYTDNYIDNDYLNRILSCKDSIQNKLSNSSMTGWLNPEIEPDLLNDIVETANNIKKDSDCLVVIGIGGSFMGCYALDKLFSKYFDDNKFELLYAGFNLSSTYLKELLDHIKDKRITINVISKSGTTLETSLAYGKIMELMHNKYSDDELKNRVIVTTDKEKGTLRDEVNEKGYKSFIIPDNIGGRYSVLSVVGLLPLATIINIKELLRGAKDALRYIDKAYIYSSTRLAMFNKHRYVENFVSYEPKMEFFLEWLKQLFGETEGKNNLGILPDSTINTRDLHSLGQFFQEGTPLLFETVIKVDESDELICGQYDLHKLNNVTLTSVCKAHYSHTPSNIISIDRIDEYSIGELIYFFMLSAAMSGFLFGVDPFNQPGVEKYKNEVKNNIKKEL